MSEPIIRATGIGKQYVLGASAGRTKSLREALTNMASAPLRRLREPRPAAPSFWALRDVGFEVQPGEVLGVIGRNGAGKSTLLKVLSRITEPTEGRIELYGRVASLLEVGTGFHGELTGRENLYLSGTILGMRKREIDRKFDEIVAFAEVEKFIDTPVKRYSSGMYVRLAFAVAAHLEPEILVVDEVLAVGDAEFQKKCLGKMGDVARGGRTVLFVSHNMAAMSSLCTRAILLENGRLAMAGDVKAAVRRYLDTGAAPSARGEFRRHAGHKAPRVSIEDVELLVDGRPSTTVQSGDRCTFRVHYRALNARDVGAPFAPQIRLFADGQKVLVLWANMAMGGGLPIVAERGAVDCTVERWPFRTRNMSADVLGFVGVEYQEHLIDALVFGSHDGDYHGFGIVPSPEDSLFFADQQWTPATVDSGVLVAPGAGL